MHFLITGGSGLIGTRLCQALLQAGHQITILSRHPGVVQKKWGHAVSIISSLNEWHPDIFFDVIINLAGEPIADAAWTEARKKLLWDSRVTLTTELVARIEASHRKPALLLSGSAIGYYGDCGDASLTESAPAGSDFAARLCLAWEQQALRATQLGVRVCLLRTGLVLTAKGGLLGRMWLPFKLGLGARLGNGRQWMSWIHIEDYVAMVFKLISADDANGAYNMTAPCPQTNAQFTQQLARAVHRPAWFVAPAFLLSALLGSRSILLLGGQQVLPTRMLNDKFVFKYPQLDAALSSLARIA